MSNIVISNNRGDDNINPDIQVTDEQGNITIIKVDTSTGLAMGKYVVEVLSGD